jgi:hypothetical protein
MSETNAEIAIALIGVVAGFVLGAMVFGGVR